MVKNTHGELVGERGIGIAGRAVEGQKQYPQF